MNPQDKLRLRDMLRECLRLRKFINGREAHDLEQDDLFLYALIHVIQVIGEAASKVTIATRQNYPDIEWSNIVGMRNWVVHNYNGVDNAVVWQTATVSVPKLIEQLQQIIDKMEN
jgi:uncharacterized protein with HEPN domain